MNPHDDIAKLVRLAGKRRAVPDERAQRVREAARAEWQREVRRRSRRRLTWAATGLAAAAVIVLAIGLGIRLPGTGIPQQTDSTGTVELLAGGAWLRGTAAEPLASPRALSVGQQLPAAAEIATDEGGLVALRLASGHSLRLDAQTRIGWRDDGGLELLRGAIYVDSDGDTTHQATVEVHTPYGIIEEIGTQFEVRFEEDSLRVRLREGAVVVHRDAERHAVEAGTELRLDLDGSVVRRAISPYGPDWEWITGVTPLLELEGRSARAFLDWIVRERGWKLAFADQALARAADEIVLSGTASRLTIEQALDAVLPTCRMTYRVENGVLVIDADPGG